jgi:uncharacterized protein (TIGR02757 family)
MRISRSELKEFLDEKADKYNNQNFIENDPISIPHRFTLKEDIEISGFLVASFSWGNRKSIIKSADRMLMLMGESPYDFVLNHQDRHLTKLAGFVHRTFQSEDLCHFVRALQNIYENKGGLEHIFNTYQTDDSMQPAIHEFRKIFFSVPPPFRTLKHVADPMKGSAAKRINMYLRWMVRRDNRGVDFGIWQSISPSALSCPLDIHSGNVARALGLIQRNQNDAKALIELDTNLRKFDKDDPVKYDFALFGLGVSEKFLD